MTDACVQGRTLTGEVTVTGVGLHTGQEVKVTLRPRTERGIEFIREDLPARPRIPATAEALAFELRRTLLRANGAEVHTAEHLLAVLYALGIDGAEVSIWGQEIPGLDGSAQPWLEAIKARGVTVAPWPRASAVLDRAIAEVAGRSALAVVPCADGLHLDYVMEHDSPSIPTQTLHVTIDAETFAREIAPARTFVLEEEVEALLKAGLGKGATTDNTLVVGVNGVRDTTLRFGDEFVRHKVLDLLGDLSLIGCAMQARAVGIRSGHGLNAAVVHQLTGLLRRTDTEHGEDR